MLGAGGHARVLQESLAGDGVSLVGFVAPSADSLLDEVPWLGPDSALDDLDPRGIVLVNGIGSVSASELRRAIFDSATRSGFSFASIVDRTAIIRGSAKFGTGVQVLAGAIVNTDALLGDNVLVNSGAIIEHHVRLGSHVHVSPGSVLGGAAIVGTGSHIGMGSRVLQGVVVGENCTVGAGAVVIADVPDGSLAIGVPAVARPRIVS